MSKVTINKVPRLMGLLIASVTLLVGGCVSSTPGAQTPAATPPPTALSVETSKATPQPAAPTTMAEKVVECRLEACVPQLSVELKPTPKEYTITIVTDSGETERVTCLLEKNIDDTRVDRRQARCDSWGVVFSMRPYTVTIGITWDGNEFTQSVAPQFDLEFPNGPLCGGQRCNARVVLELPQAAVRQEGKEAVTPTPTPTPIPANLVRKYWRLEKIISDGKEQPPFGPDLWVSIDSRGRLIFSNGCRERRCNVTLSDSGGFRLADVCDGENTQCWIVNIVTPTGGGTPVPVREAAVFPHREAFERALRSVTTYEIRDGRLWLYLSGDRSSALVFR